jgi:hypothetical protein
MLVFVRSSLEGEEGLESRVGGRGSKFPSSPHSPKSPWVPEVLSGVHVYNTCNETTVMYMTLLVLDYV